MFLKGFGENKNIEIKSKDKILVKWYGGVKAILKLFQSSAFR